MQKKELDAVQPLFEVDPDSILKAQASLTGSLAWLYLLPNSDTIHKDGMINNDLAFTRCHDQPCFGWFKEYLPKKSIGVALKLKAVTAKDFAREYYEYLLSPDSPWAPVARLAVGIRDTTGNYKALVIRSLDVPSRLLINYMIAWRLPYMHTREWDYYMMWRKLGADIREAMVLSAMVQVNTVGKELQGYPSTFTRDHHFINYLGPDEKFSYRNFFGSKPSLADTSMIKGRGRGIPNNTIWKHRSPMTEKMKLFPHRGWIGTSGVAPTKEQETWGGRKIQVHVHPAIATGTMSSPEITDTGKRVLKRFRELVRHGEAKTEVK